MGVPRTVRDSSCKICEQMEKLVSVGGRERTWLTSRAERIVIDLASGVAEYDRSSEIYDAVLGGAVGIYNRQMANVQLK